MVSGCVISFRLIWAIWSGWEGKGTGRYVALLNAQMRSASGSTGEMKSKRTRMWLVMRCERKGELVREVGLGTMVYSKRQDRYSAFGEKSCRGSALFVTITRHVVQIAQSCITRVSIHLAMVSEIHWFSLKVIIPTQWTPRSQDTIPSMFCGENIR